MNYITKTEAFAHHGATLTAPRGVWAKKSDDGKLVVLAAWRKGFNRDPFLPGKHPTRSATDRRTRRRTEVARNSSS